jgi:pre-mRNA-splicing factor CWC22
MIVDCCAQQRTYERFYGLLAERFCRLRLEFQQSFQQIARDTYNTIHRFDIKKIRIMAQLIAHLLATDAIEWAVLSEIKMNENDTSSAGRVYVKILFQELAEAMGQKELFKKLYDPTISMHFEGLLPRDHPKNTRFAINFFTLCGLGGLTIILREHYEKKMKNDANADNDSDSTTSSSSDDSSTDSSLSSSDSE